MSNKIRRLGKQGKTGSLPGSVSSVKALVAKVTKKKLELFEEKDLQKLCLLSLEKPSACPKIIHAFRKRIACVDWIICLKSLIALHHLMCYGSPDFSQALCATWPLQELRDFNDSSSMTGTQQSVFIKEYANFLYQKLASFKVLKYYFESSREMLKDKPYQELLQQFPILQSQLDCYIQCGKIQEIVNNSITFCAFEKFVYDLHALYCVLNTGVAKLTASFSRMPVTDAIAALDIVKYFAICSFRVCGVFNDAKALVKELPDVPPSPNLCIQDMETHVNTLKDECTATISDIVGGDSKNTNPFTLPAQKRVRSRSATTSERCRLQQKHSFVSARASTDDHLFTMSVQLNKLNPFFDYAAGETGQLPEKVEKVSPSVPTDDFDPRGDQKSREARPVHVHRRKKSKSFNSINNFSFSSELISNSLSDGLRKFTKRSSLSGNEAQKLSSSQPAEVDFDLQNANPDSWVSFAFSIPPGQENPFTQNVNKHTPRAPTVHGEEVPHAFNPFEIKEITPFVDDEITPHSHNISDPSTYNPFI